MEEAQQKSSLVTLTCPWCQDSLKHGVGEARLCDHCFAVVHKQCCMEFRVCPSCRKPGIQKQFKLTLPRKEQVVFVAILTFAASWICFLTQRMEVFACISFVLMAMSVSVLFAMSSVFKTYFS